MRQKGFVPILIIVVIGILAVVGYLGFRFLKPSEKLSTTSPATLTTPETSAGWKTYSNKYFSIKYPADAKAEVLNLTQFLEEDHKSEGFENMFHEAPPVLLSSLELGSGTFDISIDVFENKNNLSAGSWIQKNDLYPRSFGEPKNQLTEKIIYVGGNKAGMATTYDMEYSEAYLIPFSDKMFLIFTTPREQKALVEQILSTFKFTD